MTNLVPQNSGRFYAAHPDLAQPCEPVVLGEEWRAILLDVTRYWNSVLVPGTDISQPWKVCEPGDVAVCHDYAATKLLHALHRNCPRGGLAFAICEIDGGYHLVLLANLTDGSYVLDSLANDLVTVAYDDDRTWISREPFGKPNEWDAM